jgi:hypothetical protein
MSANGGDELFPSVKEFLLQQLAWRYRTKITRSYP